MNFFHGLLHLAALAVDASCPALTLSHVVQRVGSDSRAIRGFGQGVTDTSTKPDSKTLGGIAKQAGANKLRHNCALSTARTVRTATNKSAFAQGYESE